MNDNAPAFAQPVYEVSVEEDKEVGFVLITVTANDEDEGELESGSFSVSLGCTCCSCCQWWQWSQFFVISCELQSN